MITGEESKRQRVKKTKRQREEEQKEEKSKEEKEVAEVAEQCLMRIQADEFLRNMPPDLQHK